MKWATPTLNTMIASTNSMIFQVVGDTKHVLLMCIMMTICLLAGILCYTIANSTVVALIVFAYQMCPPEETNEEDNDNNSIQTDKRQLQQRLEWIQEQLMVQTIHTSCASCDANQQQQSQRIISQSSSSCCCPICLDGWKEGDEVATLAQVCTHSFHTSCISEWLIHHETCPCCRRRIITTTTPSIRMTSSSSPDLPYWFLFNMGT